MGSQDGDTQMADAEDPYYPIEDCLDRLSEAVKLTSRSRTLKSEPYAESLAAQALSSGLTLPQLTRLIPLLLIPQPNCLPHSTINILFTNLFPLSPLPTSLILPALSALGPSPTKPPLPTQISILLWLLNLTAVPSAFEEPRILSRVYGLLFSLLDVGALRPALCALLARITRRAHVRPYRIQMLLELCRGAGDTAPLVGLLGVFKEFYPEVIVSVGVAQGRRTRLKGPDWELVGRLKEIQGRARDLVADAPGGGFSVQRGKRRGRRGVVPEVRTAYASEESVTLEEIDSVERFVEVYEKVEPPSQMASALRDPLLQHYLTLHPSDDLRKRLQFWLAQVFDDELRNLREGGEDDGHLREVLAGLADFHYRTKEPLSPLAQTFVKQYLDDCVAEEDPNLSSLMAILPYLPLHDLTAPYEAYFSRINVVRARIPPDKLHSLICSPLISLLWNWAQEEKLCSHSSLGTGMLRFQIESIYSFVEQITRSCPLSCGHPQSDLSIPSLPHIYRIIPDLFSPSLFPLPLMPAHIVSPLLASPHLPSLNLGTAVLASYKPPLEMLIRSSSRNAPSATTTQTFNSHILDSVNLLWRNRAFDTSHGGYAFGLSPEYVAALKRWWSTQGFGLDLKEFGNVANHLALISLAKEAWEEFGRNMGKQDVFSTLKMPVSQRSLEEWTKSTGEEMTWREFRVVVVEWLSKHGVEGVGRLMQVAMKEGKGSGAG
ncbi:Mis6-domain-containing protein [Eremomyces bilateralis CBS 781.70]|uniref:Mis6-domain-containing protein n=1 Tax=Eremomyces bilateralis CBS 781.70 TaxID=1392243 RepID=A0A6G1FYR6_9PEZI|nr:Mis6-domain-containing protein [Eremomyces bilateralis CBS 781.70]KAF1810987.1 Mis6-domain-containing protein [Eremomyces bilateralis CBS 781.70]